jgi:hypothetical protein
MWAMWTNQTGWQTAIHQPLNMEMGVEVFPFTRYDDSEQLHPVIILQHRFVTQML